MLHSVFLYKLVVGGQFVTVKIINWLFSPHSCVGVGILADYVDLDIYLLLTNIIGLKTNTLRA